MRLLSVQEFDANKDFFGEHGFSRLTRRKYFQYLEIGHHTDYSPERLKRIYDKANLRVLS